MSSSGSHPPLLVLGCHRSGTSAITGLLHRAGGLYLGEVLPPSEANPVGYFESAPIVVAHNHILRALDRDWTCPPPSFEPADVPRTVLEEQVAILSTSDRPWGVKDPRLLFTLPAWLDLADEFTFVGVIRAPADIVRSISNRDQIPDEAAGRIVEAYLARLADLHRALGFPIVDFSAEPTKVVERVRSIAAALGLPWDESEAASFVRPSLIHHRSSHPDPDDNLRYLSAAAEAPIAEIDRHTATALRNVLGELDPAPASGVSLNVGPRFSERRRELWKLFTEEEALDRVVELVPEDTPPRTIRPRDVDYEVLTVAAPSDVARRMSRVRAPSHVLGPGLLEATPPESLDGVFGDLARYTHSRAAAALDGFITVDSVASKVWDRGRFVTSQTALPFHHRAEDLKAAAARSGWRSALDEPDVRGRTTFLLFKESDLGLGDLPAEVRIAFLSLEARVAALERDLERFRRADGSQPPPAAPDRPGDDRLAAELERTKAALERVTEQYERLQNRRGVRLALRLADAAKPVIRRLRG